VLIVSRCKLSSRISTGFVLLLVSSLNPPADVSAASSVSPMRAGQVQRSAFRPLSGADSATRGRFKSGLPTSRRVPARTSSGPRSTIRLQRRDGIGSQAERRSGSRKAVPVTRGQELGLRFRPDERDPSQQHLVVPDPADTGRYPSAGQGQFRPIERQRKPTYEQLQAERDRPPPVRGQYSPYPMLPTPPLPGNPQPYWPGW